MGDLGSIPGLTRSPGEGIDYQLQYSGLENSTDRGAWEATVHEVGKNNTGLSNFHFHTFSVFYELLKWCKYLAADPVTTTILK